jgi:hypothetical protein
MASFQFAVGGQLARFELGAGRCRLPKLIGAIGWSTLRCCPCWNHPTYREWWHPRYCRVLPCAVAFPPSHHRGSWCRWTIPPSRRWWLPSRGPSCPCCWRRCLRSRRSPAHPSQGSCCRKRRSPDCRFPDRCFQARRFPRLGCRVQRFLVRGSLESEILKVSLGCGFRIRRCRDRQLPERGPPGWCQVRSPGPAEQSPQRLGRRTLNAWTRFQSRHDPEQPSPRSKVRTAWRPLFLSNVGVSKRCASNEAPDQRQSKELVEGLSTCPLPYNVRANARCPSFRQGGQTRFAEAGVSGRSIPGVPPGGIAKWAQ